MSNKIIRVFLNTDMRNQHEGLIQMAKKQKVDPEKLEDGEHVIFVNAARNKLKVFSSNGLLSYKRQEKGRLNMEAIIRIPQSFSGGNLNWKEAQKQALLVKLEKK